MAISITLVCNKGGVGRSTTAQNVGWRLAMSNYKVLIVDIDSQANTSITLCKNYEELVINAKRSITDMLKSNDKYYTDYIVPTRHKNLDLLASSWELDMTENAIRSSNSPNTQLRDRLDNVCKDTYDFIIYDSPPRKLDKFIHNALVVSDYYWYIVAAENRWSLDAKTVMDLTINEVVGSVGGNIKPIPALVTMFRKANSLSALVMERCKEVFDYGVMKATIRDTTAMRKASAMGKVIYEYQRTAPVAKDYADATEELIVTLRANQHELKL